MNRKISLLIIGICAVTAIAFIATRNTKQLFGLSGIRDNANIKSQHIARESPLEVSRKNQRNKKNQVKLDQLIARWNSLPALTLCGPKEFPSKNSAHILVVKDAVDTLLCSDELIDFVKFLDGKNQGWGEFLVYDLINAALQELLQTPRSAELRVSLIELANRKQLTDQGFYVNWIDLAGKYCSKEHITEFSEAFNYSRYRFNAMGYYNIELAKINPIEAIQSSIEQWQSLIKDVPGGRQASVQMVMSGIISRLPPETNFPELEKKFPTNSPVDYDGETLNGARHDLFGRWAKFDQQAAMDYIIGNQDRLPLKLLQTVGQEAHRKEEYPEKSGVTRGDTVRWILSMPDGPVYDNLSRVVIMNCADSYLDLAKQLAARVQDKTLRDEANETIARWSRQKSQDGHAR
jgi:hypothetical protein